MKYIISIFMFILFVIPLSANAQFEQFKIRSIDEGEFYKFVKVFSEMRGPLRKEILKDKKTDYENADPLKYVLQVKDNKDVKKIIKDSDLNWEQFSELMGNVIVAYFSIQPDRTKVSLLKQLSDYGLMMSNEQIPPEYRQVVEGLLKTDDGAAIASMVVDQLLQIPEVNIAIAQKNQRQLDQLFYTRFWKDKL